MNCLEAETYISALCDAESVPPAAAQHIAGCSNCLKILDNYSTMGAKLRVAAALEERDLPSLILQPPFRRFHFLLARVSVPRFALAGLLASVVLASVATSLVLAQSKPLWFQFAYGFGQNPQNYNVAQKGYDQSGSLMGKVNGTLVSARTRIQMESISADDVVLRVRAVVAGLEPMAGGFKVRSAAESISMSKIQTVHYRPGQSLAIPVEGGGTIFLKGEVLDHQPQIAFGSPLKPASTELDIRWPVLTSGDRIIGEMRGASSLVNTPDSVITFGCGLEGVFIFALTPFPGSVKAEANWGEIMFKTEGKSYRLLTAAPTTGGDQPQTVWVRHDAATNTGRPALYLGTDPMPR